MAEGETPTPHKRWAASPHTGYSWELPGDCGSSPTDSGAIVGRGHLILPFPLTPSHPPGPGQKQPPRKKKDKYERNPKEMMVVARDNMQVFFCITPFLHKGIQANTIYFSLQCTLRCPNEVVEIYSFVYFQARVFQGSLLWIRRRLRGQYRGCRLVPTEKESTPSLCFQFRFRGKQ